MSKKNRNKRARQAARPASPDSSSSSPAPKPRFKTIPYQDIDPRAWQLAQELEALSEIPGLGRMSGSNLKREQAFRAKLSKVPYQHFTAALARLRRGESPPS